jgi:hypothetical protein
VQSNIALWVQFCSGHTWQGGSQMGACTLVVNLWQHAQMASEVYPNKPVMPTGHQNMCIALPLHHGKIQGTTLNTLEIQ